MVKFGLFQTRHLKFVYKMAALLLVNVEVSVGDRSQPLDADWLWTAEDRIEYAEGIRSIPLDSRGVGLFTQEKEELKGY